MLVLFDGWTSLFRDRVVPWRIGMAEKTRAPVRDRDRCRASSRPSAGTRPRAQPVTRAALAEHALWQADGQHWLLGLFEVQSSGEPTQYFIPLALAWEDQDEERVKSLAPAMLARVRQQAQVGVMADAFADETFVPRARRRGALGPRAAGRAGTRALRADHGVRGHPRRGRHRGAAAGAFARGADSNTGVTLGSRLFIKGYRTVRRGHESRVRGRSLPDRGRTFANCVPVAGVVEYVGNDGETTTLAMLQAYRSNQGDGWAHTLAYLERFVNDCRATGEAPGSDVADVHGAYLALVRTLGLRTGELHVALAQRTGDTAFDPEPVTDGDVAAWRGSVLKEALDTLALLERSRGAMPSPTRDEARTVLVEREALLARIESAGRGGGATLKTRYHGDYHLGQVLLSQNDFLIIDFEGEPARALEERRAKHCALRDVAGMMRSFSYARWTAIKQIDGVDLRDRDRLEALLVRWERETRREFLLAYERAVAGSGLYGSFPAARGLLEMFELEKALYELRYEINNRPGWVSIPLQGILALAGGGLAGH